MSDSDEASGNDEDKIGRPRQPLNRRYAILRGQAVVVEGNVGAGKTTLLQGMASELEHQGVPHRVFYEHDAGETLQKFLAHVDDEHNPYACDLQCEMMEGRLRQYKEGLREAEERGAVVLFDRSFHGDRVFADRERERGSFTDAEWERYLRLYRKTSRVLEASCIVYLRVSPETSMARIRKRDRPGERSGYTLEHIRDIHERYERAMSEAHVLVENWDEDGGPNQVTGLLERVCEQLYGSRAVESKSASCPIL